MSVARIPPADGATSSSSYLYTVTRWGPAYCRTYTDTQRTPGCSDNPRSRTGWTNTRRYLEESENRTGSGLTWRDSLTSQQRCEVKEYRAVNADDGPWTSPSQTSVCVSKRYPVGQWQLKLPGVFRHSPLSHSCLFTRHSSMSGRPTAQAQVTHSHFHDTRITFITLYGMTSTDYHLMTKAWFILLCKVLYVGYAQTSP